MRFAHGVSDSFIDDYASRMSDLGSIVYGYFEDGEVRAAAELRSWRHVGPGGGKPPPRLSARIRRRDSAQS